MAASCCNPTTRRQYLSLQDDLYQLFLLDQQVRGLRRRLDSGLRRHGLLQGKAEQFESQHRELLTQLKQAQARAADLEHQSDAVEQKVELHREQMNTVTTNKEYSALLVEVNTLKLEKSKREDEALAQLDEVDEIKQRIEELAAKLADQTKLVQGAETEIDVARTEVGDRLNQAQNERNDAATKLGPTALNTFERISLHHDGEALALVEEQDRRRREYCCGGCYLQLPFEHINTIMVQPNESVQCPSCHRFLYMANELKVAIGPK